MDHQFLAHQQGLQTSGAMDLKNSNHEQDQELPLATTETLRPLVQLFLAQLTAAQWARVGSGALDEKTEKVITELCVDLVNMMSTHIFRLLKTRLAPLKSTELISEEEVHQFVGDSITETFESVTGAEVPRKSARKVTEIVTREITERINSQLSNSSEGSKVSEPQATKGSKFTRRLRLMVKHVTRMLKNCGEKLAHETDVQTDSQSEETAGTSQNLQQISQTPAASLVPEEEAFKGPQEVSDQGPVYLERDELVAQVPEEVVPPGAEEIAAAESFITRTTEAVMKILSEQANDKDVEYNANISEEEHMEIMTSIIEDTNEAASDIASFIWSNREAFGLNSDGSPTPCAPCAPPCMIYCCKILANKIKTYFARKFTKEAVVCFVAKLRGMLSRVCTKETPLDVLVQEATEVVQTWIPPDNQEECIYKEMVQRVHDGEHKLISQKLGKVILNNIRPDHASLRNHHSIIGIEVDKFMKLMWNWLNQQVEQYEKKHNRVRASLKKIKGWVINLPELTEEEPKEPAPPTTTVEPDVSNDEEEDISITTANDSRPPSIIVIPDVSNEEEEEDISVTPVKESKPLPITAESDVSDDEEEEDISVTPVKESKPLPITAETEVSDDEEDELIDEEDDTPEVVPPNVTAEPAITDSAKQPQSTEPEDMFYKSMVSAVLNQIFKNASFNVAVSNEDIVDIRSALTLMLCTKLAGSDFVKPSGDKIKKTVRAVHKELCKKMGSKGVLAMSLLSQDSPVYEYVTETIKRHLVKPKKTGVKGFFKSFFKIVSKPFRACCTHG